MSEVQKHKQNPKKQFHSYFLYNLPKILIICKSMVHQQTSEQQTKERQKINVGTANQNDK